MHFLNRDGVTLAYKDTKAELPPIIFVHGCGCDHKSFAPQAEFFSNEHRVVLVDLRGHGESDTPQQDYSMSVFADDLAWLCTKLALVKPVMVGHSMGGNVLLELAARYPEIPSSVVMIDSCIFPPQALLDTLQSQTEALNGPHYLAVYQEALSSMCLPTDKQSPRLIASLQVPQHVLASCLLNHVIDYDAIPAALGCHVPIAYIGAMNPLVDLPRFQSLTPQLVIARTLGSGHFCSIEIPDQINAMIAQFIRVH
jgi:pimeloyl-ACP methyl ester carboxylesterase